MAAGEKKPYDVEYAWSRDAAGNKVEEPHTERLMLDDVQVERFRVHYVPEKTCPVASVTEVTEA